MRILHLLSQRAEQTGSGVTLDAMVRHAARAGHEQHVVCAIDQGDEPLRVGDLAADAVLPIRFGGGDLPYPIVGMSDVMPYPSSVWSELRPPQLKVYREAFSAAIHAAVARFRPQLIHSHHVWLMSSLLKGLVPDIPVVVTCHATGLRQMHLCRADLVQEVRDGCRDIDHFTVLHENHREQLCRELAISPSRVTVVGAGYRQATFFRSSSRPQPFTFIYAGKLSRSKGVGVLLDVMEKRPDWTLHVAGGGTGAEAEELQGRMRSLSNVVAHGMLSQTELAERMRSCYAFVLPSFYEGLPLVLVEAAACGCRLVSTRLPGVEQQLYPELSELMQLVDLPTMIGPDRPRQSELPGFRGRLEQAMARAVSVDEALPQADPSQLQAFRWSSVFERVEAVWHRLV